MAVNKIGGNIGAGRPKGALNKTTVAVKEALTLAFEGAGGVPALIEWAKTEKGRDEFYKLWVKMLPTDINATGDMSVHITTGVPRSE